MPGAIDVHTMVLQLLRWIHFIAGIIWLGHLYFFNFVNVPFGKALDPDTKKKVTPQLMPRALWWFRWGAMVTLLAGWAYVIWKIFIASDAGLYGTGGLFTSTWGQWITFGGLLGTIMWFNVWFIIWPIQKQLLGIVKPASPIDTAKLARRAYLTSRANTYLSIPMLFGMAGASHFPSFSMGGMVGVVVVGVGIAWALIKLSDGVGKLAT